MPRQTQFDEERFRQWYAERAQKAGIDPDPDNPAHKYDYRAAYRAGVEPEIDPTDKMYHWPSEFKAPDHPNRYVGGIDTISGNPTGEDQQRLQRIQQLLASQQPREAQPPIAAGTDEVQQARQLEQQAQPRQERPTGLLGQLGRSALEGAAGLAHPGGYYGWQADRQATERQRQQDLFTRAQALRQQAIQGQNAELAGRRLDIESQNADLERQNLVSQIRARDNPPIKVGYGANIGTYPETGPNAGKVITPVDPKATNAPNLTNLSRTTVSIGGKPVDVLEDLDPESPTKGHRFVQTAQGLKDITGQGEHFESPSKYPEPVMVVFDPKTGQNVPVTRSEATSGGYLGPQPAGVLKESRDLENSARKIRDLGTLYKDEFIGPGQGRYLNVKSKLPFTSLPEGYGDFIALQADLKNNVIKLVTGAQMGQQEADRILQQVPTEVDKPEIWKSKYKQTLKNVDYIESLIQQQTGRGGATGAIPPPPPGFVRQ